MSCHVLIGGFVVVILRGEKVKVKRDQAIVIIASYDFQRGPIQILYTVKIPGVVDGETVRVFDGMSVRTYEREDEGWEWLTAALVCRTGQLVHGQQAHWLTTRAAL